MKSQDKKIALQELARLFNNFTSVGVDGFDPPTLCL